MNPISTSTLGMSAAFSTTNPAWRSGLGSIGTLRSRLSTRLLARRVDPTLVSRRTRLARMRATSGDSAWNGVAPAKPVGAVLAARQLGGLGVGRAGGERIDAGPAHAVDRAARRRAWRRTAPRHAPAPARPSPPAARIGPSPGSSPRGSARRLQQPAQLERGRERDVLLVGAGETPIAPGSLPPWPGSSMTSGAGGRARPAGALRAGTGACVALATRGGSRKVPKTPSPEPARPSSRRRVIEQVAHGAFLSHGSELHACR